MTENPIAIATSPDSGLEMLQASMANYRALQRAAPHGSAAYRAAKVTADHLQESIDVHLWMQQRDAK